MPKIEQLTTGQREAMIAYRDRWMSIGLATGEANVDVLRPAFAHFYECLGKPAPQEILHVASPLSAQVAINLFKRDLLKEPLKKWSTDSVSMPFRKRILASIPEPFSRWVRGAIQDSLFASIRLSVGIKVSALVEKEINFAIRHLVLDQVGELIQQEIGNSGDGSGRRLNGQLIKKSVWESVRFSVGEEVWGSIEEEIWTSVRDSLTYIPCYFYGANDAYQIASYQFFIEELGVRVGEINTRIIQEWQTIAENCGCWYPYENIVVVCDRPVAIHLDDNQQLHHESKAAIEFSDGWGVYRYHGSYLPEKVITSPETITLEDIQAEVNPGIRRVMIERYGQERYSQDGGAI